MRNSAWTSLVVVAAAAFLSACASVNTVEQRDPGGKRQVITDSTLDRIVSVVRVNQATISTGFLKIQVELLNQTTSTQNFAYLIEWFDANGMIVSAPNSTWMNRQILPQQTVDITAIAPNESVKDFRIEAGP